MACEMSVLNEEAQRLLQDVPDGKPLDETAFALIDIGVKASVTALDVDLLETAMAAAMAAGATADQIQEAITLVSGLGVHSLMLTSRKLLDLAVAAGQADEGRLSLEQQALWDRYVGDDPYWDGFEAENPGFLMAMLRLSPTQFKGFHDYCAIAWKTGHIAAVTKELIAMASDAAPTHRFLSGMRHHLGNAKALGAGKLAINAALKIARNAPLHRGIA